MEYDRDGEKLDFYEDKAGKYRWRLTHNNGEIIGASSQGYKDKDACIANAERVVMKGRSVG
jgi:uncharacterized protein YegP (UPF0339 family)